MHLKHQCWHIVFSRAKVPQYHALRGQQTLTRTTNQNFFGDDDAEAAQQRYQPRHGHLPLHGNFDVKNENVQRAMLPAKQALVEPIDMSEVLRHGPKSKLANCAAFPVVALSPTCNSSGPLPEGPRT
jgi:hypothetical protein